MEAIKLELYTDTDFLTVNTKHTISTITNETHDESDIFIWIRMLTTLTSFLKPEKTEYMRFKVPKLKLLVHLDGHELFSVRPPYTKSRKISNHDDFIDDGMCIYIDTDCLILTYIK